MGKDKQHPKNITNSPYLIHNKSLSSHWFSDYVDKENAGEKSKPRLNINLARQQTSEEKSMSENEAYNISLDDAAEDQELARSSFKLPKIQILGPTTPRLRANKSSAQAPRSTAEDPVHMLRFQKRMHSDEEAPLRSRVEKRLNLSGPRKVEKDLFATNENGKVNQTELKPILEEKLESKPVKED